ncbi:uncharacterized protein YjiK [Lewinella aquimaris]|uniref:Uncharacterized protein YjiK n=1 Tax=Neolewinella aquimaris TaxID=1835722 RepID=A0A840EGY5_9BACT|nr:SdiA-regulated domain-containing protein [Neolewinella aquimaris]MBB4081069.1 uncharacterized protein YjiK [Neolewinella aquimaris]
MRFPLCLLLSLFLCTCGPAQMHAQFPYALDRLELLVELPEELAEISALAVRGDELYAVADEKGVIYRLDLADGEIRERIEFWKAGDYEGIAVAGDDLWVTKSNGRLYRVKHAGTAEQKVKEYNTWLKGENDVEGLTYDAANDRLLLACKDDPKGNGLDRDNRYIFAFDLEKKKLKNKAAYSLPREDDFSPSALDIHPHTGQLFLTSSVGKQLLVARPDGSIETVKKLDRDRLPQPEGLVFTPDGTLYLSTEARDGAPARIYRLPLTP